MPQATGHLRIGELSRRVGVSPELLRAWERRYGLLQPTRSAGGFRLYSEADETRVRAMREHLDAGLSAAEAARATLAAAETNMTVEPAATADPVGAATALLEALERYDEQAANGVLDRALSTLASDTVLSDVVIPVLRAIGERWSTGELAVAQEHFASTVLRGRLLGLARGWGRGSGPIALLACPPGEQHDLPLVLFGLGLREHGWRIVFLGADTPIATIERAVDAVAPQLVVFATTVAEPAGAIEDDLRALAARVPVAIGGRAADTALAERVNAQLLDGDPIAAAAALAARRR